MRLLNSLLSVWRKEVEERDPDCLHSIRPMLNPADPCVPLSSSPASACRDDDQFFDAVCLVVYLDPDVRLNRVVVVSLSKFG
jgi:hypothetical protein